MEFTLYSVNDGIGYITLNRPDKRNALNERFVSELKDTFNTAIDDEHCKVIVLKANGKAFCAGADLAYLQQLQKNSFQENEADSQHLMELFDLIHRAPKVVIAQVQGHALAGGCGLATVADFTFSVPEAKFGYTEVKIGFVPAIVMVYLIRKIGEGRARNILLTGEVFDANKALELGMITQVSDAHNLEQEVAEFAQNLMRSNSRQSMALIKQMIANVQDVSMAQALEYAAKTNALARESEDCKKGIAAFLNKEKIEWK